MFSKDQEVQKSPIDIYFTSFKNFLLFLFLPKTQQYDQILQPNSGSPTVISSVLRHIGWHRETPEPRDWEEAGNLLEVQPQVSLSLAMGWISLGWSDSAQKHLSAARLGGHVRR